MQVERKVTHSAIAGAITGVIVWIVAEAGLAEIPPGVASNITLIIMAITAYMVKNNK